MLRRCFSEKADIDIGPISHIKLILAIEVMQRSFFS